MGSSTESTVLHLQTHMAQYQRGRLCLPEWLPTVSEVCILDWPMCVSSVFLDIFSSTSEQQWSSWWDVVLPVYVHTKQTCGVTARQRCRTWKSYSSQEQDRDELQLTGARYCRNELQFTGTRRGMSYSSQVQDGGWVTAHRSKTWMNYSSQEQDMDELQLTGVRQGWVTAHRSKMGDELQLTGARQEWVTVHRNKTGMSYSSQGARQECKTWKSYSSQGARYEWVTVHRSKTEAHRSKCIAWWSSIHIRLLFPHNRTTYTANCYLPKPSML